MDELKQASQRPASFWQTIQAVLWSFFGVRRQADHAADLAKLNPLHIIVAGLLMAALFVFGLLMIVRWVVAK